MLLHSRNLKHHLAASSNGRYALNSIALMRNGALSTDGHVLMFTPYPDADPAELPKIDGVNPVSPPPDSETPFLVSPADAARAAAMAGKAGRHDPETVEFIQAEIGDEGITFGATDLTNAQLMKVRQVEGQFPEVGAVIPDYSEAMTTSIDIDKLLRSLKALKGATREKTVTIRVIDDQNAMGLSCKDGAALLVMPIQVERPTDHSPDQLAKLRGVELQPAGATQETGPDTTGREKVEPEKVEVEEMETKQAETEPEPVETQAAESHADLASLTAVPAAPAAPPDDGAESGGDTGNGQDNDEDEDWMPTEHEVEEAYEAFASLPPLPEHQTQTAST